MIWLALRGLSIRIFLSMAALFAAIFLLTGSMVGFRHAREA